MSALVLILCGTGCASTQPVPPGTIAEANRVLEGRAASVELGDRTVRRAYDVVLGPDTTRWEGFNERNVFAVPTRDVERITIARGDRFSNTLIGTGLGLLAGAVVSTGTALVFLHDDEGPYAGLAALGLIVGGTGVGGLLGFGFGVASPLPERAVVYERPLERYLVE